MGRFVQIVCSVIIGNLCMAMGIMLSWPSSTVLIFESANTTLHRPMSETEIALFGSLYSIGALIGTPMVGFLLDRLGRKKTALLSSFIGVIAWTILACTTRVEVILFAMFVGGLTGGVNLIVPLYIGEICDEFIRGAMCSFTIIFFGMGLLVSYLFGWILEYSNMIYFCLGVNILVTSALSVLKESPTYLMMKGREKEAASTIAFYRRVNPDSKEVLDELKTIERSLNPQLDGITPHLSPEKQDEDKIGLWKFINNSSSTRAAIYMTLTVMSASYFGGLIAVQVYAEPIFEEALPSISSNICCILLAVVGNIAGIISAYLTEVAGRRPLMIYTSFAATASCILLGIQLHLHWGPNWLIAVNIYFFTAVFSMGSAPIPYVLLAEVFLPDVKSFMSMLVIEWSWLCNSIILFVFPHLRTIGLGPIFYIFAVINALTGIYSIFYVPETKGLTVDAIQERLTQKKRIAAS